MLRSAGTANERGNRANGILLLMTEPCSGVSDFGSRGSPVQVFPTLEATQGQIYGLCSQLSYNFHQNRVATVDIDFRFAPGLPPWWSKFG